MIIHGDCLTEMRRMDADSVDTTALIREQLDLEEEIDRIKEGTVS